MDDEKTPTKYVNNNSRKTIHTILDSIVIILEETNYNKVCCRSVRYHEDPSSRTSNHLMYGKFSVTVSVNIREVPWADMPDTNINILLH